MSLSLPELEASRTFLAQAHILVSAVRTLFFGAGDQDTAARLSEIASRLDAEHRQLERLKAKQTPDSGTVN